MQQERKYILKLSMTRPTAPQQSAVNERTKKYNYQSSTVYGVLNQILERPPEQSRFLAKLSISRREAKKLYEFVQQQPKSYRTSFMDTQILNQYKQTIGSVQPIELILTVLVYYGTQDGKNAETAPPQLPPTQPKLIDLELSQRVYITSKELL